MAISPEDEPLEVSPGTPVRIRERPLVEFPPEIIGFEAEVVEHDPATRRPYTLEITTEHPTYHGRQLNVKRGAFTTNL